MITRDIDTDIDTGDGPSAARRKVGVPVAAATLLALTLAGCGGAPASPPAGTLTAAPTTTTSLPVVTPPTPVVTPPPSSVPTPAPPLALAEKGPRPANGAVIVRQGKRGGGVLNIDNGTEEDAYVTLARDGKAARAVYVRAGQKARLPGIADGDYQLFYATGSGWNVDVRDFTLNASYNQFDESFPYETTARKYTIWDVTLRAMIGGNARTSPVAPGTVPR